MIITDATADSIPGITEIYNDAVLNSTAIWNEETVSEDNRFNWWVTRVSNGYPVLVALAADSVSLVDDVPVGDHDVLGYATFGDWRAFDGYRYTVEHSVYVRSDQRGNGVGTALMQQLISRARQIGKHAMIAGIDASNTGSIALHERLGFEKVGELPQVGVKFGKWLDLAFLQLTLDDREQPE